MKRCNRSLQLIDTTLREVMSPPVEVLLQSWVLFQRIGPAHPELRVRLCGRSAHRAGNPAAA